MRRAGRLGGLDRPRGPRARRPAGDLHGPDRWRRDARAGAATRRPPRAPRRSWAGPARPPAATDGRGHQVRAAAAELRARRRDRGPPGDGRLPASRRGPRVRERDAHRPPARGPARVPRHVARADHAARRARRRHAHDPPRHTRAGPPVPRPRRVREGVGDARPALRRPDDPRGRRRLEPGGVRGAAHPDPGARPPDERDARVDHRAVGRRRRLVRGPATTGSST